MRRRQCGVGTVVVLALLAAALTVAMSPLGAAARPPPPVPAPSGDDPMGGAADPDALGTEAPGLPPTGPDRGAALDWEVTNHAQGGVDRVLREIIVGMNAAGVIRVLMHI